MARLNEILISNKQVIAFVFLLLTFFGSSMFGYYIYNNLEYLKKSPCEYCMEKTNINCIVYDNSIFKKSSEQINITYDQFKSLQRGNLTISSVGVGGN